MLEAEGSYTGKFSAKVMSSPRDRWPFLALGPAPQVQQQHWCQCVPNGIIFINYLPVLSPHMLICFTVVIIAVLKYVHISLRTCSRFLLQSTVHTMLNIENTRLISHRSCTTVKRCRVRDCLGESWFPFRQEFSL